MPSPPTVRQAIIDRVVALTPTSAGASAYSGSGVALTTPAGAVLPWSECITPMTPASLPSTLAPLSVWVELGDARTKETRPSDPHLTMQEVALLFVYPCRSASEAETADFARAWHAMTHLYQQLIGSSWGGGTEYTIERAPVFMLRPQRIPDIQALLCELRLLVFYSLEA